MELMLTKVLHSSTACQIIAMSATVSGLETLRCWLKARLFVTNYRPIPLSEHIVANGEVRPDCSQDACGTYQKNKKLER